MGHGQGGTQGKSVLYKILYAVRELRHIKVSIDSSEITIGGVEIKDDDTNLRANVITLPFGKKALYVTRVNDGLDYAYEDSDFQAGESPVVLDVEADMGRKGVDGFVICDGPGDLFIEVSPDGASYGGQFTMKKKEVYELTNQQVSKLRITHSGDDSGYRVKVL